MTEFFTEYGLFFAKAFTIVIAIMMILGAVAASASRQKKRLHGHLDITPINKQLKDTQIELEHATLSKDQLKLQKKSHSKQNKADKKKNKARLFILNFFGDIKASAVDNLRKEVTAILTIASTEDTVLVNLESGGGMVHSYGLAAAQLDRLRRRRIPLIVAIDKIAASGGYMMACVANEIISAPFAIIGSVGVVGQVPNFNRFLKKHAVDFEQHTAGDYKRTLTVFGENTDAGREKFKTELEHTHQLFKAHIREYRPSLDVDKIATGEHWYGSQAKELNLVDRLLTSDDLILEKSELLSIYQVQYVTHRPLSNRISDWMGSQTQSVLEQLKWGR